MRRDAGVEIVLVDSAAELQQVTELSRGFVAGLVELDKSLGVYDPDTFEAYGYAGGQAHLPGDYAPPGGCLLLAVADSQPAGCVALRKIDETTCEMRMLFVEPGLQGLGIGRALVLRLLEQARSMGYSTMRLDTMRPMVAAHRLYGSLGFREVEPHDDRHDSLTDIKVFMERSLGQAATGMGSRDIRRR